jgi:hypothetical protein
VYVKMDCMQPPGSFKIRGIGKTAQEAAARGVTHLVSSSGGNAGLATAYAGQQLGLPVTVVLPESTPRFVAGKLAQYGATAIFHGEHWALVCPPPPRVASVCDYSSDSISAYRVLPFSASDATPPPTRTKRRTSMRCCW